MPSSRGCSSYWLRIRKSLDDKEEEAERAKEVAPRPCSGSGVASSRLVVISIKKGGRSSEGDERISVGGWFGEEETREAFDEVIGQGEEDITQGDNRVEGRRSLRAGTNSSEKEDEGELRFSVPVKEETFSKGRTGETMDKMAGKEESNAAGGSEGTVGGSRRDGGLSSLIGEETQTEGLADISAAFALFYWAL